MSGGGDDDDDGDQAAPPLKVTGLPLCWIQSTEPPSADVPPSLGQAGWLRDFLETIDCSSPAIRLLQVPLIPSHYPLHASTPCVSSPSTCLLPLRVSPPPPCTTLLLQAHRAGLQRQQVRGLDFPYTVHRRRDAPPGIITAGTHTACVLC